MTKNNPKLEYGNLTSEQKLQFIFHELVIPLSTIRGCAELIQLKLLEESEENEYDAHFLEYTNRISEAGKQISELIDAMAKA